MRDGRGEFLEPALTVGNLGAEQILMVAVKRLPLQIFVGSVSHGHRSPRQDILDPPVQAGLLQLRRMQRMFDGFQNGADASPVGFSVPIG